MRVRESEQFAAIVQSLGPQELAARLALAGVQRDEAVKRCQEQARQLQAALMQRDEALRSYQRLAAQSGGIAAPKECKACEERAAHLRDLATRMNQTLGQNCQKGGSRFDELSRRANAAEQKAARLEEQLKRKGQAVEDMVSRVDARDREPRLRACFLAWRNARRQQSSPRFGRPPCGCWEAPGGWPSVRLRRLPAAKRWHLYSVAPLLLISVVVSWQSLASAAVEGRCRTARAASLGRQLPVQAFLSWRRAARDGGLRAKAWLRSTFAAWAHLSRSVRSRDWTSPFLRAALLRIAVSAWRHYAFQARASPSNGSSSSALAFGTIGNQPRFTAVAVERVAFGNSAYPHTPVDSPVAECSTRAGTGVAPARRTPCVRTGVRRSGSMGSVVKPLQSHVSLRELQSATGWSAAGNW